MDEKIADLVADKVANTISIKASDAMIKVAIMCFTLSIVSYATSNIMKRYNI